MALKTYAFANEFNGLVSVSILDETDPEVQEGQVFKELTEAESKLGLRYRYDADKKIIVDSYPGLDDEAVLAQIKSSEETPTADLATEKKLKIAEIRNHFNNIVETIKLDVAPYEVATWDVQRIEYAEWLKDNSAPIPYVTALAEGRGMAVPDLMAKIGYRVTALARVQGIQQALESQTEACETIEQVQAIAMPALG